MYLRENHVENLQQAGQANRKKNNLGVRIPFVWPGAKWNGKKTNEMKFNIKFKLTLCLTFVIFTSLIISELRYYRPADCIQPKRQGNSYKLPAAIQHHTSSEEPEKMSRFCLMNCLHLLPQDISEAIIYKFVLF